MRAFFLILVSLLVLCVPCAGWAASATATQDPRTTIQSSVESRNGLTPTPVISSPGGAAGAEQKASSSPLAAQPVPAVVVTDKAGKSSVVVSDASKEPSLEFQSFVAQTTQQFLPLFGQNFFSRAPSSFAPVEDAPVSADYVIGPGDEILIRAWGQVDIDYRAKVDRAGNLNVPKVGVLHVAGTEYRQLNTYLRTAIGRVFRNFELNVSLGELRAIQIFTVGYMRYPGSYLVSSMSTLLSAILTTGGVSNKGSMRRIILRRNNVVVSEFDLYDFLLRADKSKDVKLLPGDVIQALPVGPLAAVFGSVHDQAIFELKKGESLAHLLAAAGGLSTTAAGQKITLERIVERSLRKVEEFNLDTDGLARMVLNGDIVRVYAISPQLDNVVSLRGNVATPANIPWRKGMRVSDLIPDRAALLSRAYWINRNSAINMKVEAQSDFRPRVEGELNWDYAVIERMHPLTQAVTLIPFNLAKAILRKDPQANLVLEPGDVVTIFSREDIRQPIGNHDRFVRLEGEVRAPGLYRLLPNETLRQLVQRVGGLTPNVYLFGAELTRISARNFQQQRMNDLVDRMSVRIEFEDVVNERNNSVQDIQGNNRNAQSRFLTALSALRASGRVTMHVPPSASRVDDLPDLPLEDGDRLYFPPLKAIVTIVGAVENEGTIAYRANEDLSDYLNVVGGLSKEADSSALYILRVDGSVWSRRNASLFSGSVRVMPGDTIVVPYETDRTLWRKVLREWAQVFYQFGIGIAAINSLSK